MSGTPRAARSRRPGGGRFLLLLTAMVVAAIDLVAKALAEARLGDTSVDLGVLQLRLAHNSGVAFSLGHDLPTWVVVALTSLITASIAFYGWRHAPTASRIQLLAGAAIVGGAVANVIDRVPDGVVTDYLHTGWWPTFNLADTFLVVGGTVLVLSLLQSDRSAGPSADAPVADALRPTAPETR